MQLHPEKSPCGSCFYSDLVTGQRQLTDLNSVSTSFQQQTLLQVKVELSNEVLGGFYNPDLGLPLLDNRFGLVHLFRPKFKTSRTFWEATLCTTSSAVDLFDQWTSQGQKCDAQGLNDLYIQKKKCVKLISSKKQIE